MDLTQWIDFTLLALVGIALCLMCLQLVVLTACSAHLCFV